MAAASFSTRFAKTLGLQDGYQLKLMKDKTDPKETRHQHYQLYWKNALVEGGHLSLHSRKGTLTAAHSRIIDGLDVATDKAIAERTALAAALTDQKMAVADVQEKLLKSQLVLTSVDGNYTKESYRLAYYFDVYSSKKTVLDATRVYVDATSGAVLKRISLTNNCFSHGETHKGEGHSTGTTNSLSEEAVSAPMVAATFNNLYPRGNPTPTFEVENTGQGSQTRLTRSTNNVPQALRTHWDFNNNGAFDDPIPINPNLNWGNNIQAATLAHWTTWRSYEYFLNRFGINGTNGQGQICQIFVSPILPNEARWITFSDGSPPLMSLGTSTATGNLLSTVDIVAHEFGHGMSGHLVAGGWQVTNGEPGSLNEGFSDIIGAVMERQLLPEGAPNNPRYWQIAEDAFFLRDMANPHDSRTPQPQTYLEPGFWNNNPGGPHQNNGVLNKWFHTLNTGNGPNNVMTTPISSFDDAMSIVYWALDFYIYGDYNYPNAENALRAASSAVFGACSPQQNAVIQALRAVNLPVADCDQSCNFLPTTSTVFASCNQTITLNAGCNGAIGSSCVNTQYSFSGPNVPFNQGGSNIAITAPSSPGSYEYAVTMSKPGCNYSPRRTFNVSVNCAPPQSCDFSSGPRYVGTWGNLTVQIRSINGRNVLVTAITGGSADKYYPRGDNFWASFAGNGFNVDPNAANLQGCLNAGSTNWYGLEKPGYLAPPPGYTQGQEQDGSIFFTNGGNPPNPCDFTQPRTVGTWNGLTVQIRQYPNNKKVLVTAVNGASNDKHYPRGDNFWDNFTKDAGAEQYRGCLNAGETGWFGLSFPGGVSPSGGYQQGQEPDGAVFFSTNGLRKAAPEVEPTLENVALVTVRPNPAQDEVVVSFTLIKAGSVPLRILDIQGRVLHQQKLTGAAGVNEQTVNVSALTTGLYAVEVTLEQQRIIHKMVKQ